MKINKLKLTVSTLVMTMALGTHTASAETLRLLTWGGYAPENVVEMFEKETGHTVEVTKSNNEEMIAKLRATGGGGFDLAQPSQDRISGPQVEFGIYKPIDLSKIKSDRNLKWFTVPTGFLGNQFIGLKIGRKTIAKLNYFHQQRIH